MLINLLKFPINRQEDEALNTNIVDLKNDILRQMIDTVKVDYFEKY